MQELGTYIVTYPCWAFATKESFVRNDAGKVSRFAEKIGLLVISDTSRGDMFPVFTDSDLAVRFKEASSPSYDGDEIFAIKTPSMFASILRMAKVSADALTLDKPAFSGKPFAIWPIDYAIEQIEAGQNL
jgi:hypothetical protein